MARSGESPYVPHGLAGCLAGGLPQTSRLPPTNLPPASHSLPPTEIGVLPREACPGSALRPYVFGWRTRKGADHERSGGDDEDVETEVMAAEASRGRLPASDRATPDAREDPRWDGVRHPGRYPTRYRRQVDRFQVVAPIILGFDALSQALDGPARRNVFNGFRAAANSAFTWPSVRGW